MKQVTYYEQPTAKSIVKGAVKAVVKPFAKIIIGACEIIDWVDEQLFLEGTPITMKLQYWGVLAFMFSVGGYSIIKSWLYLF